MNEELQKSIAAAQALWGHKTVGSQRASAEPGTTAYFEQIRSYRYGYETPFIPEFFRFRELAGKRVLEIGVGQGTDGIEMARHGARYTGIDVTDTHLALARKNFELRGLDASFVKGDLLTTDVGPDFDVVYSFGVLHHIAAEADYLERIKTLLRPETGRLMIAVYSKFSFFNAYMVATWLTRARSRPLNDWRSQVAEYSKPGSPVTIKIRSRREVQSQLESIGFIVEDYAKCGFVQGNLPVVGKYFSPSGPVLSAFARGLGWYHCFICRT